MFSESVHLPSSRQDGVRTLRWTCAYVGLEEGAGPPPPGTQDPCPAKGMWLRLVGMRGAGCSRSPGCMPAR